MQDFKAFSEWFQEKDRHIIEHHLKKDRMMLKGTLRELNKERRGLRDLLNHLEKITEREEAASFDMGISEREMEADLFYHGDKLMHIVKQLMNIWSETAGKTGEAEEAFMAEHLPKIHATKQRVENRLRKLEEIIAKTRVMLDDLAEDLCFRLSRGHDLAAVGQALLDHFGREFKQDHGTGRKAIRHFLETHYQIDKTASRELFALLEDVETLDYHVDLPEDKMTAPSGYYSWQEEGEPQLYIPPKIAGVWEIRA